MTIALGLGFLGLQFIGGGQLNRDRRGVLPLGTIAPLGTVGVGVATIALVESI